MIFSPYHVRAQRGYTLLFAVLLTSVIISVAVSIMNIARKEIVLTGSSRESVIAIAAADAGIECATHYDQINVFFHPTKNDLDTGALPYYNGLPFCGGLVDISTVSPTIITSWPTITNWSSAGNDLGYGVGSRAWLYRFFVRPSPVAELNDYRCTVINVIQGRYLSASGGYDPYTVIDSIGYNIGFRTLDPNNPSGPFDCGAPSANKVERAIHLMY
jgi:hypothetical protein